MSRICNAILLAGLGDLETEDEYIPVTCEHLRGLGVSNGQCFKRIGQNAGGHKVLTMDVFAGAFNYVSPADLLTAIKMYHGWSGFLMLIVKGHDDCDPHIFYFRSDLDREKDAW